jgi:hypothetical protein
MGQDSKWSNRLKNNLTNLQFNHLVWRFEIIEGKNHNDSDIDALIQGLRFVLQYKVD